MALLTLLLKAVATTLFCTGFIEVALKVSSTVIGSKSVIWDIVCVWSLTAKEPTLYPESLISFPFVPSNITILESFELVGPVTSPLPAEDASAGR